MILKAEPCLVVSIQNQLTLCIETMIVRQIPVARKLKLLFGDCADTRNKIAEVMKTKLRFVQIIWNSGMDYMEWGIWRQIKK